MTEPGPICPQCGTTVQPTWDWCHQCGYNPAGHAAGPVPAPPAAPTGPAPPPPPPPPAPPGSAGPVGGPGATFVPTPIPYAPPPVPPVIVVGPPKTPSRNRGLWIVVAVAVVGLVLLTGLVLHGQSTTKHAADAIASSNATASTASTLPPTTTADPKTALGQQYLTLVGPANAATTAYIDACPCKNGDAVIRPADLERILLTLPALITAKQAEAAGLDALSVGAPPLVASHLESMSHLEATAVLAAQQLQYYAPNISIETAAMQISNLNSLLSQGQQMGATVRTDLGLPASGDLTPTTI